MGWLWHGCLIRGRTLSRDSPHFENATAAAGLGEASSSVSGSPSEPLRALADLHWIWGRVDPGIPWGRPCSGGPLVHLAVHSHWIARCGVCHPGNEPFSNKMDQACCSSSSLLPLLVADNRHWIRALERHFSQSNYPTRVVDSKYRQDGDRDESVQLVCFSRHALNDCSWS